ncbi:tetratricopeptide repeat protein, partial [Candidatus Poribacteria bacterium]|nr:tetratricopeptide repeat protein [Candidatus Poribacteria bacterium]
MTRLTVTALALFIFTCAIQAQDSFTEIKSALQAKQFTDAVKQIDDALVTADDERDVLLYLKGLALFYAEDFTNAIQACDRLLTAHPNSAWFRKATFLKAQCYLKQKAYEQAEAIYSAETDRLLAADRKSEMAQVYIELAEEISKKPEKDELTAPPPNYQKAYG